MRLAVCCNPRVASIRRNYALFAHREYARPSENKSRLDTNAYEPHSYLVFFFRKHTESKIYLVWYVTVYV
jgi:hypothetical protein